MLRVVLLALCALGTKGWALAPLPLDTCARARGCGVRAGAAVRLCPRPAARASTCLAAAAGEIAREGVWEAIGPGVRKRVLQPGSGKQAELGAAVTCEFVGSFAERAWSVDDVLECWLEVGCVALLLCSRVRVRAAPSCIFLAVVIAGTACLTPTAIRVQAQVFRAPFGVIPKEGSYYAQEGMSQYAAAFKEHQIDGAKLLSPEIFTEQFVGDVLKVTNKQHIKKLASAARKLQAHEAEQKLGHVFDSATEEHPFRFSLGSGQVLKVFAVSRDVCRGALCPRCYLAGPHLS